MNNIYLLFSSFFRRLSIANRYMASPIKTMAMVAITTYMRPELRIISAISTSVACCANTVKEVMSRQIIKANFFMLINGVTFVFNKAHAVAQGSYPYRQQAPGYKCRVKHHPHPVIHIQFAKGRVATVTGV